MDISRRNLLAQAGTLAVTGAVVNTLSPGMAAAADREKRPSGEELCFETATDLLKLMKRRKVSPVEVVQAHLDRIDRLNPSLNAFVTLLHEQALAEAQEAEKRIRRGDARALEGLPLGVKDLFDFLEGVRNTFGSVPMRDLNFIPPHSAVYVHHLTDAGAIPVGKTNTPEMGHEGITDNFAFGPTSSPFDPTKNAGGSSGGSSAAVAGFLAPLTQGSDAGGSVRIPAAFTATVGFKPSVGRIPQDVPPIAHTPFFSPGPITRTVTDAALMMSVMGVPFSGDPLSMPDQPDYLRAVNNSIAGKKIAFSPALDIFPVEPEVARVVRESLGAFRDAGATVEETSIGFADITVDGRPVTQQDTSALWVQEQSVLYAHAMDLFLGIGVDLMSYRDQLNPEFAGMVDLGNATSARQYRFGDFLRTAINSAVEQVFTTYDFIVSPTLSVLSVTNTNDGNTLGPAEVEGVPTDRLIGWCLTYPFNFSGHPAISIPAGFASNGFPVGLQIVGKRWQDTEVLAAARAFEKRKPWYDRYPR